MTARHSNRPKRVLVVGGSGFIGRHAVAALLEQGAPVVIGSRDPEKIARRLPARLRGCERRRTRFEQLLSASDWRHLLVDIDVVVNCVGILRPRGVESYRRIHELAPRALAAACSESGCRVIHVSALGLSATAKSGFLQSKRAGELAISGSGADWAIVRPSLLDGEGGFGARWLRRVARWPIHPVPADSTGRVAVLDVRDLGEALARLALDPRPLPSDATEREFDLGGTELRTLAEHLAALRRSYTEHRALELPIPGMLARIASHLCDLLHFSPFSFGHWELLRRDNCPQHNRLQELLGRAPRVVGDFGTAKTYRRPARIARTTPKARATPANIIDIRASSESLPLHRLARLRAIEKMMARVRVSIAARAPTAGVLNASVDRRRRV